MHEQPVVGVRIQRVVYVRRCTSKCMSPTPGFAHSRVRSARQTRRSLQEMRTGSREGVADALRARHARRHEDPALAAPRGKRRARPAAPPRPTDAFVSRASYRNPAGKFAWRPPTRRVGHERPAKRELAAAASSADDAPQRPSKFGRLQIAEAARAWRRACPQCQRCRCCSCLATCSSTSAAPSSRACLPPLSLCARALRNAAGSRCAWAYALRQRRRRRRRALRRRRAAAAEIGSWRAWYSPSTATGSTTRARHAELLLTLSQCAESSPNCRRPPTPGRHSRLLRPPRPADGVALPVNLEVPGWWSQPPTYAIFDATDFVNFHPGSAGCSAAPAASTTPPSSSTSSRTPSARARCFTRSSSGLGRCRAARAAEAQEARPMLNALTRWLASRWRRDEGEGERRSAK